MSDKPGVNLLRMMVLQAVQRGIRGHDKLITFDSKQAPTLVRRTVEKLVKDGGLSVSVIAGERRYQITAAGQAMLPGALPVRAWSPLQLPQPAPRRPGADAFRAAPSVAADAPREWVHPC